MKFSVDKNQMPENVIKEKNKLEREDYTEKKMDIRNKNNETTGHWFANGQWSFIAINDQEETLNKNK